MLHRFFIFTVFAASYLNFVTNNCTDELYGLYCTNIGINQNQPIILDTKKDHVAVTSIFLRNTTGIITKDTFKPFPNLKHLDIQFSIIHNFTTNLTSLHELYLIKNYGFPNLTRDFLEKCQNLSILIIQDNPGLNISEEAFTYAKKLNHLTINNQNITHLKKDLLEGLQELTYLDLKQNHIEKIDETAFEDLQNLNFLILSDNNFHSFGENTFKNLRNLQSLDLLQLNITSINKSTFKNQKQLRYLGIPTKLIKQKLTLENLTNIFSNLETIGFQIHDQNDSSINKFIQNCKYSGFNVRLV